MILSYQLEGDPNPKIIYLHVAMQEWCLRKGVSVQQPRRLGPFCVNTATMHGGNACYRSPLLLRAIICVHSSASFVDAFSEVDLSISITGVSASE